MLEGRLYIAGIPCDARRLANLATLGIVLSTAGFHHGHRRQEPPGPRPASTGPTGGLRLRAGRREVQAGRPPPLSTLDASEAHNLILNSLPFVMRPRLSPHLPTALGYAEHYGLDPFWVLAVMWTESHFQSKVVSSVGAKGLMQVMPATALHIGRILDKGMDRKVLLEYAAFRGATSSSAPSTSPISWRSFAATTSWQRSPTTWGPTGSSAG